MEAMWIRFHLFFIFAGFIMLWNNALADPEGVPEAAEIRLLKSPPLTMIS